MRCHRTKCPLLLPILSEGLFFSQMGLSQGFEILHGFFYIKIRFGFKKDLRDLVIYLKNNCRKLI